MLAFSSFKQSWKEIQSEFIDYFFLFFQFLYFARLITVTLSDAYLVFHLLVSFAFVVLKRKKFNPAYYFYLIAGFLFINIIPSVFYGFSFSLIIGYVIRLSIAFLIVVYFGERFFIYLETLVFFLSYIGLILFIIQIIFPAFFNLFTLLSDKILYWEYSSLGGKYLLIYFFNGSAIFRNSGFLSEPSLYAIILSWLILFNFYKNNFKDNTRLRILLLSLLTTFSVGGFFYIILLIVLYTFKNTTSSKIRNLLIVILLSITTLPFLQYSSTVKTNLESMQMKIEGEEKNYYYASKGLLDAQNISRVSGAKLNLEYFFNWPFGYGLNPKKNDDLRYLGSSPNGLSRLIVTFGLGFLVFLLFSAKNTIILFKLFSGSKIQSVSFFRLTDFLSMVVFIIPLGGYSLFNQPLMIAILYWSFVYKKKLLYSQAYIKQLNK